MTEAMARRIPDYVTPDQVYDLDIYWNPELTKDIHVAYARLHGKAPDVFWTPANGGRWIVTRHDAIVNIVMDYEHFSVREMRIPRIPNPPRLIPLNVDPPESVPYRQMLAPFFSPRAVGAMTDKIRQRARDVVAEVAGRGRCDFVEEVAARFPVSIFLELMGLPADRVGDYRVLAERFFKARDGQAIHEAVGAISAELVKALEQARAAHVGKIRLRTAGCGCRTGVPEHDRTRGRPADRPRLLHTQDRRGVHHNRESHCALRPPAREHLRRRSRRGLYPRHGSCGGSRAPVAWRIDQPGARRVCR
jgi:hypothetical protein